MVDTRGRSVFYTALAVDSSGHSHILYQEFDDPNELRYATNSEGPWKTAPLGTNSYRNAIALDANDMVHVAVVDRGLRYGTNITGEWAFAVIDDDAIGGPAIGLDSSGKVHLAYLSNKDRDVKYATNASGAWERTKIDSAGSKKRDFDLGLAVDSAGRVHIAYYDVSHRALKYATNKEGAWAKRVVTSVGEYLASRPSIAVTDHMVHIVFADQEGFVLRHALWGVEQSAVSISAHSESHGLLRVQSWGVTHNTVAHQLVDRWITEDLDTVGNTNCSMTLDASGNLLVAFVGKGLSFGVRSKDSWTANVVDPEGGHHSSISLDKLGKVHICHVGENKGLKVARQK